MTLQTGVTLFQNRYAAWGAEHQENGDSEASVIEPRATIRCAKSFRHLGRGRLYAITNWSDSISRRRCGTGTQSASFIAAARA